MISRYEIPTVSLIWSEAEKWSRFLKVELALMEALEAFHQIPEGTSREFERVKINPDRIREIEKTTRHDVVAFCTSITEQVSPESSRYFHYGVTSSDIIDTALALQIKHSLELVAESIRSVISALDELVRETDDTLCLGRSHGMAAEPMILAQKFFSFRMEFSRRLRDVSLAIEDEITGQLSGAVGNYSILSPAIETLALAKLGLRPEPVSTQVIPRDRIGKIVTGGALIASAIERVALELRHLGRSEVGEVVESFVPGQIGSSVMPHKKNPISAENLCGIARIIRSHTTPMLENISLWHERDISHSSVERLLLPDHFGLLVYSLNRLAKTLGSLEIRKDRIRANLVSSPGIFSSLILHSLIAQNDHPREDLYQLVQAAAFQSDSLEGLISEVARQAKARKLNATLSGVSLEALQKHYKERFLEVKNRAEMEQS